ncbi:type I restriction enzyme S subunit [Hydrogenispora ethanolica]|jgi:type I restriction enzyme S subunit|uniref:Type I restriction enzyme S subunit n=1 Tax=Hydrogenispora ethanolica TaxID=1082276 RepID=A0A4R1RD17_HYDET|nr:restriction endonuclease subunit S [Hydrogenispora ethanolica]TCL63728.1 type I restriction enzyme S subunit [Hydrogenispora ethanolica]
MTEWREYRLSDIMDIISGGTPKTSVPEYWSGNIPWLSVADFNNVNRYVYDTEKHISELGLKNSSTKILKKGQLIISARGTVGALAQLKRDMAFNQSCYGLNANSLTTNDFLFYLLKYCIAELKQQSSGGVFDTIIRETFDNISVFLPPLPEQKAIADVLSSLDDKIDLLTRQNKTLEDLAQAYFRKWFIEDANDEWEEKSLYEVVDILSGGTPSTKVAEYWGGNIPWFTPKDASNLICMDTEKHITQEGLENCNSRLYSAGTVFISARGTVGKLAICGVPMAINQSCYALVGKGKMSNFIVYLILSYVLDELLLNATGAVFDAITTDTFKVIKLPLPPLNDEFYYRVKDILSTYYEKIVLNTRQIILLQKLRDILLPKLINGEIRIRM